MLFLWDSSPCLAFYLAKFLAEVAPMHARVQPARPYLRHIIA